MSRANMLGSKSHLHHNSTNEKAAILFNKIAELVKIVYEIPPAHWALKSGFPSPLTDSITELLALMSDKETLLAVLSEHKMFFLRVSIILSHLGSPHVFNKILRSANFDMGPESFAGNIHLLEQALTIEAGMPIVPATLVTPITSIFEHVSATTFNQLASTLSGAQKNQLLLLLCVYQTEVNIKILKCISTSEVFVKDLVQRWASEPISVECYDFIFSSARCGNLTILKSFLENNPERLKAIIRHFPYFAVSLLREFLLSPLGYDIHRLKSMFEEMDIFNHYRIDLQKEFVLLQDILTKGHTHDANLLLNSPWVVLGQFWHHPNISPMFKKDIAQYFLQHLSIDLETHLMMLPLTPADYALLSMNSFEVIRKQLATNPTASCRVKKFPLLHWAISQQLCDPQTLELFLSLGFSIDKIYQGKTPLHEAAQKGRFEWFKALLAKNADIDMCALASKSPVAEPDSTEISEQTPFCLLMENNTLDENLLLQVLALKPNLNIRNATGRLVKDWMENKLNPNYAIIQHARKILQQDNSRFISVSEDLKQKLSSFNPQIQQIAFPADVYYKILSYCFPYQRQEKLAPIAKPTSKAAASLRAVVKASR